jgi:citrate synthase
MTDKQFKLIDPDSKTEVGLPVRVPTLGPNVIEVSHLYAEHGVFTYDPSFAATASCQSAITYIDGEAGVLLYRGYPIEQLAELSSFLEVSYLLLHGELPTDEQLGEFDQNIRTHTMINESLLRFFNGFHYNAHPMAMVSGVVASMSAFYHDSTDIRNPQDRDMFAHRIMAKLPTIAAAAYKHSLGQPFVYPQNRLDYCSNLLHMFFAVPSDEYEVNPVAAEALDLLFILHADHEQNCSTSTVRLAGSSGTNPYSAIAAGMSALWGPAHGGANEAVINMLEQIGRVDRSANTSRKRQGQERPVPAHGLRPSRLQELRPARGDHPQDVPPRLEKLGHASDQLLFELALKLEEHALKDEYFIAKNLYPNVDFYSGIIYRALGIPKSMFTVMFAIARTVGWVTHWREMVADPETRIGRPRQLYIGHDKREYVPLAKRR